MSTLDHIEASLDQLITQVNDQEKRLQALEKKSQDFKVDAAVQSREPVNSIEADKKLYPINKNAGFLIILVVIALFLLIHGFKILNR